jgi:hypothetical protein
MRPVTASVQLVLPLTYLILTNRTVSVLSDIAVLLVMMMLSNAYLSISVRKRVVLLSPTRFIPEWRHCWWRKIYTPRCPWIDPTVLFLE